MKESSSVDAAKEIMTEEKSVKDSMNMRIFQICVFLAAMDGRSIPARTDFPAFFQTDLNIDNPIRFLAKLSKQGLIHSENGIAAVTEAGYDFLRKHQEIPDFFSCTNSYVSLRDCLALWKKNKNFQGKDIAIFKGLAEIYREKYRYYKQENDYRAMMAALLESAEIAECNGDKKTSLEMYMKFIYLKTSGIEYYPLLKEHMSGAVSQNHILHSFRWIVLSESLRNSVAKLEDYYSSGMDQELFSKIPLPINLITPAEFKELLDDIFGRNYDVLAWQLRFRETFNEIAVLAGRYINERV